MTHEKFAPPSLRPDDTWQHVAIGDNGRCKDCAGQYCLTVCPSDVFQRDDEAGDGKILVYYRQCIECGACRLVCPADNISFDYPRGGFGVEYRQH